MEKTSKVTYCASCGADLEESAKVCPECGVRFYTTQGMLKFIAGILLVAVLLFVLIIVTLNADSEAVKEAKKMPRSSFIESCGSYDYKELADFPNVYNGKPVLVSVKLTQDVNDKGNCFYAAGVEDGSITGNLYLIHDAREERNPALFEEDVLTVYGIYEGKEILRYSSGKEKEIPSVSLLYFDLKSAKKYQ